jgi:chromosome segregation ATPase
LNGELFVLRQEASRLEGELLQRGEEAAREQRDLRHQLEGRDQELQRLYLEEQALRAVVEDQTQHLGRVYDELARLRGVIADMEATRAWRLHRWVQSRRGP